MDLSLTKAQFRYQLETHIFSQCLGQNMEKLTQLVEGQLIPSKAFSHGGIHEVIDQYEDVMFYEILAEEMALRDVEGQCLTPANYGHLLERIEAYLTEFYTHGTDHVHIDLD